MFDLRVFWSVVLFSLSAASLAQQCEKGLFIDDLACKQASDRIWTLRFLRDHENNIKDARGNLELLVTVSRGSHLNIRDLARFFVDVQSALGGVDYTQRAREAFLMISSYSYLERGRYYSLSEVVPVYISLSRPRIALADVNENFELVMQAAFVCGSLQQATDDFLEVLKEVGGGSFTSSFTKEARKIFRVIYGV